MKGDLGYHTPHVIIMRSHLLRIAVVCDVYVCKLVPHQIYSSTGVVAETKSGRALHQMVSISYLSYAVVTDENCLFPEEK